MMDRVRDDEGVPPGLDELRRLAAAYVRIVHHIPGRVRMKLDGPVPKLAVRINGRRERLLEVFHDIPGIRSIALNGLARSCTVTYDPHAIAPNAWPDLIEGFDSQAAQTLLTHLVSGYCRYASAIAVGDATTKGLSSCITEGATT